MDPMGIVSNHLLRMGKRESLDLKDLDAMLKMWLDTLSYTDNTIRSPKKILHIEFLLPNYWKNPAIFFAEFWQKSSSNHLQSLYLFPPKKDMQIFPPS